MAEEREPAWLDDEERLAWLTLSAVSMRLPAVMDTRLQRDASMSLFEYLTLAMLSEQPDRTLPMTTMAALTTSTLPRLSHVVRRLEDRGWLARTPSPDDGRITLATLTEAGWDALVAAAPGHVDHVRAAVVDRLTRAQLRQLAAIGRRLLPALWPEGVPLPHVLGQPDPCPSARPADDHGDV